MKNQMFLNDLLVDNKLISWRFNSRKIDSLDEKLTRN